MEGGGDEKSNSGRKEREIWRNAHLFFLIDFYSDFFTAGEIDLSSQGDLLSNDSGRLPNDARDWCFIRIEINRDKR